MSPRNCLIALAVVCSLMLLPGCEQKAEVAPTVTLPAGNADPAVPDLTKLPPDEGYGTVDKPVGAGSGTGTVAGTVGTPTTGQRIHVMQKNDTIFRLGERYYGRATAANAQKIMAANGITDPKKVPVGARIVIPD